MAPTGDPLTEYFDPFTGLSDQDSGDTSDWRASTPAELRRPTRASDLPAISQHQRTLESLEARAVEDALANGCAPLRYCHATRTTYRLRSLEALETIQRRERAAFRW